MPGAWCIQGQKGKKEFGKQDLAKERDKKALHAVHGGLTTASHMPRCISAPASFQTLLNVLSSTVVGGVLFSFEEKKKHDSNSHGAQL